MFKKRKAIPRKVGKVNEEEEHDDTGTDQASVSAVKKPAPRPKRAIPSLVRPTYHADDDGDDANHVTNPTKLGASSLARQQAHADTSTEPAHDDDPYSAANLATLKSSSTRAPPPDDPGPSTALIRPTDTPRTSIPTDAEIREKKERRRRLALESGAATAEDFIPLDDPGAPILRDDSAHASDSDPHSRSLIHRAETLDETSKWGESRLVHEDEDIAEGFDEFVEDAGRVTLSKHGMLQQERDRRAAIAQQIRAAQLDAQDDDDDEDMEDVDAEDVARVRAYEAAQTRAGAYGAKTSRQREKEREEQLRRRLEVLPATRPVPPMSDVVARFRAMVADKKLELQQARDGLEELAREREEIGREEVRIQGLLREAGERFERLRADDGGPPADAGRGLESLGALPAPTSDGGGAGGVAGPASGMAGVARDEYYD